LANTVFTLIEGVFSNNYLVNFAEIWLNRYVVKLTDIRFQ